MTRCLSVAIGVALCSGIVACTKATEARLHDPAADKAAIDVMRGRLISALNTGRTDAAITLYTDDVLLMPNHGPAVTGIAAARAWLDTSFSQVTMAERETSSSVDISGDLAVDHYLGELTVTVKAPGAKPFTEGIKGINVYRRQADGNWKITKVIWNGDEGVPTDTK